MTEVDAFKEVALTDARPDAETLGMRPSNKAHSILPFRAGSVDVMGKRNCLTGAVKAVNNPQCQPANWRLNAVPKFS